MKYIIIVIQYWKLTYSKRHGQFWSADILILNQTYKIESK